LVTALAQGDGFAWNATAEHCSQTILGTLFDLTPLSGTDYKASDPSYDYTVNICGTVSTETSCSTNKGAACQYTPTGGYLHMLSSWVSPPVPAWDLIDPTTPATGVKVKLINGDSGCPGPRSVEFQFKCGPTLTTNPPFTVTYTGCSYLIVFTTSAGCPSVPGGGSKLSGGFIFVIILLVSFVVYVVVGCIYKKVRLSTSGFASCPNNEFWVALPGLVKDGCVATFSICRRSSSSSGGYETVK